MITQASPAEGQRQSRSSVSSGFTGSAVALRTLLEPDVKVMLINSAHNPSGRVYSLD